LNIWEIIELEKKYMTKIQDIIFGPDFIQDLNNIESYINDNYEYISKGYAVDNKIAIALERLLTFHLYAKDNKLNFKEINELPISSDVSFYAKDALLNIEAKTIDMINNKGDDDYIELGPNQSSIKNKLYIPSNTCPPNIFDGYQFHTRLNEIERGFPNLTYSISLMYYDNDEELELSHLNIYCIPNGIVARELFNNDLYTNTKTFYYLSDNFVKTNKLPARYLSKTNPPDNPNIKKLTMGKTIVYFDPYESHPLSKFFPEMIDLGVTWAKENKKWKIRLYAKSARLEKAKIESRFDKNKMQWAGWVHKPISTKSHLELERKYNSFRNNPFTNISSSTRSIPNCKLM